MLVRCKWVRGTDGNSGGREVEDEYCVGGEGGFGNSLLLFKNIDWVNGLVDSG